MHVTPKYLLQTFGDVYGPSGPSINTSLADLIIIQLMKSYVSANTAFTLR